MWLCCNKTLFTKTGSCPSCCGSVDWVLAWKSKDCMFDSQSRHMPGLQARSPPSKGRARGNHTLMFLSFSSSLPLSKNKYKYIHKHINTWLRSLKHTHTHTHTKQAAGWVWPTGHTLVLYPSNKIWVSQGPGWCGSVDWVQAANRMVAGLIPSQGTCPSGGHTRGNHTLIFLSLSPSLPFSLNINKIFKKFF